MKIRSFILTFSLFAFSVAVFAQKAELQKAKEDYHKFAELKEKKAVAVGLPSLNSAKASIDKATQHEKTKNDASAWAYRGMIYADLAMLDSVESKTAPLLTEALNSAKKSQELDKDKKSANDILRTNQMVSQFYMNSGVRAYQNKDFPVAYTAFNSGSQLNPGDTTFIYYAGASAIAGKDYDKAIEKYTELLKTNYGHKEDLYLNLSSMYVTKKDTASAIKIAGDGAKVFPGNAALARQEIELSLMNGKEKEVISKIEAQAAKEPDNKTYPFYLGIAYNAIKDEQKAEEAYRRALAIDPNYGDAALNLGVIIMNRGIDLNNKAANMPANKQQEYNALIKKSSAEIDKAFPYLEKAVALDPKSRLALDNIRVYYVLKKNEAKAAEYKKKVDSLR